MKISPTQNQLDQFNESMSIMPFVLSDEFLHLSSKMILRQWLTDSSINELC